MDVSRVEVVVYQDGEKVGSTNIGYFVGQAFTVKLDTPDGTDWKIEHIVKTNEKPAATFAWLIERGQAEGQKPTMWLNTRTQGPGWYGDWTLDANQATKFDTCEEAEEYVREHVVPTCRVTEHGWPA